MVNRPVAAAKYGFQVGLPTVFLNYFQFNKRQVINRQRGCGLECSGWAVSGLDISNDDGSVKGGVVGWRGEWGQGRRCVAFLLTLEAALHAFKLEPGTKRRGSF
jgi:hypothetical protein